MQFLFEEQSEINSLLLQLAGGNSKLVSEALLTCEKIDVDTFDGCALIKYIKERRQ